MSKIKEFFSQAGQRKMTYLLIILVLLVVLDGLLTQFLIDGGNAHESNSFLAPIIGDTGFMLLKIFGSLICAFILFDVYRQRPRWGIVATWIAVMGYGAIVLWNTSLFLLT